MTSLADLLLTLAHIDAAREVVSKALEAMPDMLTFADVREELRLALMDLDRERERLSGLIKSQSRLLGD